MGTVAERRNPFCSLPVSEDEMDSLVFLTVTRISFMPTEIRSYKVKQEEMLHLPASMPCCALVISH